MSASHNEVLALLRAARQRIADPKHWTQGAFARDAKGRSVEPRSDAAVCWCALGALDAVSPSFDSETKWAAHLYLGVDILAVNDSNAGTHGKVLAYYDRIIAQMESAGGV